MGAICGIIGKNNAAVVKAMAKAMMHRGEASEMRTGKNYALAAEHKIPRSPVAIAGQPEDADGAGIGPKDVHALIKELDEGEPLHVRGPYAGAVSRDPAAEWWLIRDRLGRCPLYYAQGPDYLLFASELNGLLASGLAPKHLDLLSVDRYLTTRCVPSPDTILQGVYRVRPGYALVYKDGALSEADIASVHLEPETQTKDSAARMLADRLQGFDGDAAQTLLWSSGIDSAALAAFLKPRNAVHVALNPAWQDESRLAKESAHRLDMPLTIAQSPGLSERIFFEAVAAMQEPIGDPAILPHWLIVREAAKHGQRLMSGHGADELLGGFPRYHFWTKAKDGAQDLVPVNLLTTLLPAFPPNSFIKRASRYLSTIRNEARAYLSLVSVFDEEEREELYTDAMKAVVHQHGGSLALLRHHFNEGDLTQAQLSLDLTIGLPDILLTELDRVATAHGCRLELPYLSDDVVDLALTLPPEIRFGVRAKPLLRQATKNLLPASVRNRARRGFSTPQQGSPMAVIERVARETITQDRVEAMGIFKWRAVERILDAHSHNIFRRRQFWALLMLFAWYRAVMED